MIKKIKGSESLNIVGPAGEHTMAQLSTQYTGPTRTPAADAQHVSQAQFGQCRPSKSLWQSVSRRTGIAGLDQISTGTDVGQVTNNDGAMRRSRRYLNAGYIALIMVVIAGANTFVIKHSDQAL